ncbi:MAG: ubiquinone/menaquinone biosynthesis methyltransferase [Armatimonadetes bacterium]|nr:ubiquinone/menaquinone biosynthesis methyltransferase [Armatimonadota bacterium]
MPVQTDSQPIWKTEGDAKRSAVQSMFAEIAPTYDLMNSLMTFRQHYRWRALATQKLNLRPGDTAIDICSGTGDFLPLLRKAVDKGVVLGLDFCAPMLQLARPKGADGLTVGDACRLPVRANVAHGVTVGWGIRNVPDIDLAHREIYRVLRPGGTFVSIDMARPRNPLVRWAAETVNVAILPLLGSLFRRREAYKYLPESAKLFKSREELIASMERAGFVATGFRDLMLGTVCMHWGMKA